MALTEIPIELSSTPSIVDGGNATAITIDSSENVTLAGNILHAGDLTLDAAGDIILDADGADVIFKDGGTSFLEIDKDGNNARIKNPISDGDVLIQGNDGGSIITALTLDMSAGGTAIFNTGVNSNAAQGNTAFYAATAGSYIQTSGASSNAMGFGMTGGNASPATAASTSLGFHHWNNSSWANPVSITRDGITFNGDTAEANALDDYEEGTWTPTDGSGASLTLGATNNRYTKVGRLVVASVRLTFPTTSSTTTAQVVLPFTVDSNAISSVSGGVCTEQNYDADITLTAAINDNTRVIFRKRGVSGLTNANLSGKILRFTVTYHAA